MLIKNFEKIIFPLIIFVFCISVVNASSSESLDPDSVREIQGQTITVFEEILAVKDDLCDLLIRSQSEEMPKTLTENDVQLIEQRIERTLEYLRRAARANTISEKRLNTSMAMICVNSALSKMISEIADFNNALIHR